MMKQKMSKSDAGKLGQIAARQTQINQKIIRINKYNNNPIRCITCNTSISYDKRKNSFCSHSCAAKYNNSKYPKRDRKKHDSRNICIICGNKTYNKNFCSNICRKHSTNIKFKKGLISDRNTMKRILIEKLGHICQMCNLSQWNKIDIALEIDHIDGDASNNTPKNIRLICPNCHATTSSWKGRNRGNGRKSLGLPIN